MSDAGPIISLERLTGGFRFIRRLYDKILVPDTVLVELSFHYDQPDEYLTHHKIDDLIDVRRVDSDVDIPGRDRLHDGEVHAIQLAIESGLPLLIEETAGRTSARAAGLSISGIAGQIIKAYRQDLIDAEAARNMLKEMVSHRRINERIYEQLTQALDED